MRYKILSVTMFMISLVINAGDVCQRDQDFLEMIQITSKAITQRISELEKNISERVQKLETRVEQQCTRSEVKGLISTVLQQGNYLQLDEYEWLKRSVYYNTDRSLIEEQSEKVDSLRDEWTVKNVETDEKFQELEQKFINLYCMMQNLDCKVHNLDFTVQGILHKLHELENSSTSSIALAYQVANFDNSLQKLQQRVEKFENSKAGNNNVSRQQAAALFRFGISDEDTDEVMPCCNATTACPSESTTPAINNINPTLHPLGMTHSQTYVSFPIGDDENEVL